RIGRTRLQRLAHVAGARIDFDLVHTAIGGQHLDTVAIAPRLHPEHPPPGLLAGDGRRPVRVNPGSLATATEPLPVASLLIRAHRLRQAD
ncbi:MAG: hypothetical protein ACHBNF_12720, partial [Chromatiales bacterium]